MANKPLFCKLLGHKINDTFTYGDPRFSKRWNEWLNEAIYYENFFHQCIRKNCEYGMLISRWTKSATRKMIEEEI